MAGSALGLIGSLASFWVFAIQLGSVQYGRIGAVYAWTGILSAVTSVALSQIVPRFLMRDGGAAPSMYVLGIGTSLTCYALLLGLAPFSLSGVGYGFVAAAGVIEIVLQGLLTVRTADLLATSGYHTVVAIRSIQHLVRLLAIGVVWLTGSASLGTFALVQLVGAMSALVATVALSPLPRVGRMPVKLPQREIVYDYLRSAALFGLLALQNDYDKAVLVQFGFLGDLGYYAAAYKLVGFIELPQGQLIAASYRPMLQIACDNPRLLPREIAKILRVLVAYGFLAEIGVIACYPLAASLLGEYGPVLKPLLVALVPVIVLRGVGAACSNGLIGLGHIGLSFWATALATAVSIALYYALIPVYSWRGAVAGTLGGEVVAAAFLALALRRKVREVAPRPLGAGAPTA